MLPLLYGDGSTLGIIVEEFSGAHWNTIIFEATHVLYSNVRVNGWLHVGRRELTSVRPSAVPGLSRPTLGPRGHRARGDS